MGEITNGNRCVILGGGDILDYDAVASEIAESDFIVCADSGFKHCEPLGVLPGLLVGDFDSIGMIPDGIPLVALPADKDYTDTTLAAEEAVSRGFRDLMMAGIMGGRPDHTFANFQTLAGLSRRGVFCYATDGVSDIHAFTAPAQGKSFTLRRKAGHYFSVFSISSISRNVSIRGGKYPLSGYDLRFDEARAVSNEFLSGDAVISLEEGTLLIMTTALC